MTTPNSGTATPNPGSDAAIEQRCTCPRMDNANGAGVDMGDGEVAFWQSTACPLHFNPAWDSLQDAVGKTTNQETPK